MKILFAIAAFTLSASALADGSAPLKCRYVLDREEYWDNASGVLTLGQQAYRCTSYWIGGDQFVLCKKNSERTRTFPFVVGFDGGEADFTVSNGLSFDSKPLCRGKATQR